MRRRSTDCSLASIGVFTEIEGTVRAQRDERVPADRPRLVRGASGQMFCSDYEWIAWGALDHSVRTRTRRPLARDGRVGAPAPPSRGGPYVRRGDADNHGRTLTSSVRTTALMRGRRHRRRIGR
jgi:hypothetical protein